MNRLQGYGWEIFVTVTTIYVVVYMVVTEPAEELGQQVEILGILLAMFLALGVLGVVGEWLLGKFADYYDKRH